MLQKFQSLYNLENHDNCIQFPQNYGECPPDYDQYFISQKLKYRVKTSSRHNIASIAYFKRQVSCTFVYNFKFFYILKHLKFKLTEENQASVEFYSDVLSQLDSDQGINNSKNNNFICTQQYTEILARSTGCPK